LNGLLLTLAAAVVLFEQAREVHAQNVLLAAVTILMIVGCVRVASALIGADLGVGLNAGGWSLLSSAWLTVLVWLVNVLTCRGTARVFLRPWRGKANYGFAVLGLSAALIVPLDFGLSRLVDGPSWSGTAGRVFGGCVLTALVILVAITPALLDKKPATSPKALSATSSPDRSFVVLWVLLNLLGLADCCVSGFAKDPGWLAGLV
jgi:hypothetical protein